MNGLFEVRRLRFGKASAPHGSRHLCATGASAGRRRLTSKIRWRL